MNPECIQAIRSAVRAADYREARVREVLADLAGPPIGVEKAAKDLDTVLAHVERGAPKLVSGSSAEMAVLISVRDLALLMQAVAKPKSFHEALVEDGFVAASGPQPELRRPRKRNPLIVYRGKP